MKRLYKHFTKGWFHYSDTLKNGAQTKQVREARTVLRWPSPTEPKLITLPTPPVSLESPNVQEILNQSLPYGFEDVQPLLPKQFRPLKQLNLRDDEEEWRQVLEYLNRNYPPGGRDMEPPEEVAPRANKASRQAAAPELRDGPKKIIPVTALRRLYDLLCVIHDRDFETAISKPLLRRPLVTDLLLAAQQHLKSYRHNADDPGFHPPRSPANLWWPRYRPFQGHRGRNIIDYAKWLTSNAGEKNAARTSISAGSLQLFPLDYEINPLRTQRAIYEDGRPGRACGSGGIDLLLQHETTPVIGEIKAATDVSLFKGLMQALVYAVELSSESQRQRLREVYSDCNPQPPYPNERLSLEGPLTICLFYEATTPAGLDEAKKLAESIVENRACKAIVGSVHFIRCSQEDKKPLFSQPLTIAP